MEGAECCGESVGEFPGVCVAKLGDGDGDVCGR